MKFRKAARHYAAALYEYAKDHDCLEDVYKDMTAIRQSIRDCRDLKLFVRNQVLPPDERRNALSALFENQLDDQTFRFLRFIEMKSRLSLLEEMCEHFIEIYLDHKNVIYAHLESAHPFTEKNRSKLLERLKTKFDHEIRFDETIDPRLIGGFKIRIGDKLYDHSIQTQLRNFYRKTQGAQ